MQLTKSLYASLVSRTIKLHGKDMLGVGVIWPFSLDTQKPVLEADFWNALTDTLSSGIPLDSCFPKRHGEFLASGSYYAPNGQSVTEGAVSISVDGCAKSLYVVGDREWRVGASLHGAMSNPTAFSQMPMTYDHAFGGENSVFNPVGIGDEPSDGVRRLPNVEYPDQLMTAPNDKPRPAGFGVIGPTWQPRIAMAGTYDEHYVEKHFPGMPEDFNIEFFNDAPDDQQVDRYWQGGEVFVIKNMHPSLPEIKGTLPKINARVVLEQKIDDHLRVFEVNTQCDTVWFFPDKNMGALIHHACIDVFDPNARDVMSLLLAHDDGENSIVLDELKALIELRKQPNEAMKLLADTSKLVPAAIISGEAALVENHDAPFELHSQGVQETFLAQKEQESNDLQQKHATEIDQVKATEQSVETDNSADKSPKQLEMDIQVGKLQDAVAKLTPTSKEGQSSVDLSSIDMSAFADLKNCNARIDVLQQEMFNEQLQATIDRLEKTAPQSEELAAYKKLLDDMALPPILPRVELEEATVEMQSHSALLSAKIDQARWNNVGPEQLANLTAQLESIDNNLDNVKDKFFDGYLTGAHLLDQHRSPHRNQEQAIYQKFCESVANSHEVNGSDYAFVNFAAGAFRGLNFARSLFEYAALDGASFESCQFSECVLAYSNCRDTVFRNCNFTKANLGSAILNGAKFVNCQFDDAAFGRATVNNCEFENCKFNTGLSTFLETKFQQPRFINCEFDKQFFIEVNFDNACFKGTRLIECQFVKSQMVSANFESATIEKTNFVEINASSASFNDATLNNIRFLGGSNLQMANFNNSRLQMACFMEADLSDAAFCSADLTDANFADANAVNADFSRVIANRSQWNNAELNGAKFYRANLLEASLYQSKLQNADFTSANLYSANLMFSTMGKTCFNNANLELTIIKDWQPA